VKLYELYLSHASVDLENALSTHFLMKNEIPEEEGTFRYHISLHHHRVS